MSTAGAIKNLKLQTEELGKPQDTARRLSSRAAEIMESYLNPLNIIIVNTSKNLLPLQPVQLPWQLKLIKLQVDYASMLVVLGFT